MICEHILLITFETSLSSFFSTQLSGSKYCTVSPTIQLNITHLFALSLNVKQFYLTHR